MTPVDRLFPSFAISPLTNAQPDARSAAMQAIGDIGHRVLSWVSQTAPVASEGGSAWARASGVSAGDFTPDTALLSQRGDVYGLRSLASDIAGRFGADVVAEGELLRSLEGFAREAALHFNGLAGLSGDDQTATAAAALDQARALDGPDTINGVIDRINAATNTMAMASSQ